MSRTSTFLMTLGLGVLLASPFPVRAVEEPLGRLFFTAEQRATLDRQRQHPQAATPPRPEQNVRLDGIVLRNAGPSTVWVNGRIHEPSDPIRIKAAARADTAHLSVGRERVPLRVGDTWHQASGKTQPLLPLNP